MSRPPILVNGRPGSEPEPHRTQNTLRAGPHQSMATPNFSSSAGAEASAATPADEASAAVARRRMSIEQTRAGFRRVPNAGEIARRRRLLRWTKWVLPVGALLLLASIAAWPELDRSMRSARLGLKQVTQVRLDSGRMLSARYRGLDTHNRPYMLTADEAQQAGNGTPGISSGDRINLTRPVADTLTEGGSWIRISAADGVYMQHTQLLDVTRDVTLYRDDGIMMTSPAADIDLKRGIIASNDWVHAEGPFGILDAQAYLLSQRDGLAQFRGPGRLILNDDRIARPAKAVPAAAPAGASQ